MATKTFEKVDIRELIDRAGFDIFKSTVPNFKDVEKFLHDYYDKDKYPHEHVGEPCYILQDGCGEMKIRGIYVGDTLKPDKYFDIIESLGVFTDDLLYNDIVGYIFGTDYDKGIIEDEENKRYFIDKGNCSTLYDYIISHSLDIGSDITYLYALKTGDTQYFEELTD